MNPACITRPPLAALHQFGQPVNPPPSPAPVQIATDADLAVAKYDNPDPVVAGCTLTYTIVATKSAWPGVRVTDTLPADIWHSNANTDEGPSPLVWNVGSRGCWSVTYMWS